MPPGPDLSLESYAVSLINATPAGEQITFALRDFNRQRVADALIAAHVRGVRVDGVIDGGERNRPVVGQLLASLGADRFVICGSPTFVFNSLLELRSDGRLASSPSYPRRTACSFCANCRSDGAPPDAHASDQNGVVRRRLRRSTRDPGSASASRVDRAVVVARLWLPAEHAPEVFLF